MQCNGLVFHVLLKYFMVAYVCLSGCVSLCLSGLYVCISVCLYGVQKYIYTHIQFCLGRIWVFCICMFDYSCNTSFFHLYRCQQDSFGTYFCVSGAAKAAGNLSCVACQEGLTLGILVAKQTTT